MALVVKDRVKETTATTGSTDAYNLAGAVTGFQTFNAVLSNGDTTYYCCTDGTDFEVGIGTFASSGTTLARTTILESSNSNNAVNWSSGTRDIFITQPAEKAVFLDSNDRIATADGRNLTNVDAATLDGIDSTSFLRSDAADSFSNTLTGTAGLTTSTFLESGRGSGGVSLTVNDGYGNANIAFNHRNGTPEQTGQAGRIQVNTDNTGTNNAQMQFQLGAATADTAAALTEIMRLKEASIQLKKNTAVTGNITVTGTVDGRDVATDGSKLDGIEASADVTDTANVTAAGALMDSEVTNLAQVKAFDSSDYATAAQGTTADAAMPKAGGTFTGDVTFTGDSYNVVWDKSDNALEFADDAKATFGNDADLKIYHDHENSYIEDSGTGNLNIKSTYANIFGAGGTAATFYPGNAVTLYYNNVSKLATTADGITVSGDVLALTSTDAGASAAPSLQLYRNSASPADNDDVAQIQFHGENDADEKVEYARIDTRVADVTDGTEDGQLDISVIRNGTSVVYQRISYSLNQFYQNLYLGTGLSIQFEGDNYNSNEISLTAADPTADRTITLPDATGTVLTTGNSDTPTTTTSSSDADFVLVDDGGTMKKITPANLGITAGAASTDDATALAIALG